MSVKLAVIYPRPNDIEAFETLYNRDHVPLGFTSLGGKQTFENAVSISSGGAPVFLIAEEETFVF